MKITELFELDLLGEMVSDGWVRIQRHPRHPELAIANYTDTCAYQRVWNEVTTVCRGLIWDSRSLEVLARPWPKFFNHGEPGTPEIHPDREVEVTDKLDGSLGILYRTPDGQWSIATRGSFDSEQARHATALLRARYVGHRHFRLDPRDTHLFEIIYRGNRIVCDYGDTDDLVLLGAVEIATGISCGPHVLGWPGPRAQVMGPRTFAESLTLKPRTNAEGVVVRILGTEHRVKIKQDDYVALHRIITGCTRRRLWECVAVSEHADMPDEFLVRRFYLSPARVAQIRALGPQWLDRYLENTPEEFRDWVQAQVDDLRSQVQNRWEGVRSLFYQLCGRAGVDPVDNPSKDESKRFAQTALEHTGEDRATFNLLMTLWRNKEITSSLLREVYPEHELPYRALDEAVA